MKMFNWFCDHLLFVIVVIFIVFILFTGWLVYGGSSSRIEQIKDMAEGQLLSIRCTGAWSYYDIELKFDNGSMILVYYSFSRNLKEGYRYKIWYSSFYGLQYKVLK